LLVFTLFLPRFGLLLAWCSGQIPANNIPFVGDVVIAIFLPRLLMIIYIIGIYGFNGWFWAHLMAWILAAGCIRFNSKKNQERQVRACQLTKNP
jgi:hypothetical protein